LVRELADKSWRAAIVGPHGSGKSTLLETLKPALVEAGCHLVAISLHDGEHRLARSVWQDLKCVGESPVSARRDIPAGSLAVSSDSRQLLIIDGYEQLSWLERWRVDRFCRDSGIGLLVTSHAAVRFPVRIPTLIVTTPSLPLVSQLVDDLASKVSTPITPEDVAASHACHGSNVRDIFFDLYDRHELRRSQTRTQTPSAS